MANKEKIIDVVMEQIKEDLEKWDFTAVEELLKNCTKKQLIAYLPENKQDKLKNDKE